MRKVLVLLLLGLLLSAAGCSKGKAPAPVEPAPPAPSPAPDPAPSTAVVVSRQLFRDGPGHTGLQAGINTVDVPTGTEEAIIGSGEVMVTWSFAQAPADLRERIRSSGFAFDSLNLTSGVGPGMIAQAHFPAGAPERTEVWVEGVAGSKLVLVRRPEPTLQVIYRVQSESRPVEGAEVAAPEGPFALDFLFDQPMEAASLDRVLMASKLWGAPELHAHWATETRAVLEFSRNPGRVDFATQHFRAATGLLAVPRPLILRQLGQGAYLERVDLATGARVRVMELPAEIQRAQLSADQRYLAVEVLEPRPIWDWWPSYVMVADLAGRTLARPPLPHPSLAWSYDGPLLALGLGAWGQDPGWAAWDPQTGQVATHEGGVFGVAATTNPRNGDLVASLERDNPKPGDASEKVYPYRLVISNLATGDRRVVHEQFINSWYYGKDGIDLSQWLTWSADGTKVLALNQSERGGFGGGVPTELVAYDLPSQHRAVLRADLQTGIYGRRLLASPGGEYLLTVAPSREAVVVPLAGGAPIALGEGLSLSAFWDRSGERLLYALGDWGRVQVRTLKAGVVQDLGPGLPAGWAGDAVYIIRWPGSDSRYIYQGI